jgi:heat shock protein HspQ
MVMPITACAAIPKGSAANFSVACAKTIRTTKDANGALKTMKVTHSKFNIGAIVRHRHFDFRGVIFDIDPEFANTDDWYEAIPADRRPRKDQPFYHLLAENPDSYYVAYVSEQNLVDDQENGEVGHPLVADYFDDLGDGNYKPRHHSA